MKRAITVLVPVDIKKELRLLAFDTETSQGDIVAEALLAYFKKLERSKL